MPVLRTSASDFTSFQRVGALLPTDGKWRKFNDAAVNRAVVAPVTRASLVGQASSTRTSVITYVFPWTNNFTRFNRGGQVL